MLEKRFVAPGMGLALGLLSLPAPNWLEPGPGWDSLFRVIAMCLTVSY